MGKWADNFKAVEQPLIRFGSWKELNGWADELGIMRELCCPLFEEQYVLNCYALYREGAINEVVSDIYTDGYAGKDFTITAEVPIDDVGFDLCSLPLYWAIVGGEEVALYPEEIFVNW